MLIYSSEQSVSNLAQKNPVRIFTLSISFTRYRQRKAGLPQTVQLRVIVSLPKR